MRLHGSWCSRHEWTRSTSRRGTAAHLMWQRMCPLVSWNLKNWRILLKKKRSALRLQDPTTLSSAAFMMRLPLEACAYGVLQRLRRKSKDRKLSPSNSCKKREFRLPDFKSFEITNRPSTTFGLKC